MKIDGVEVRWQKSRECRITRVIDFSCQPAMVFTGFWKRFD